MSQNVTSPKTAILLVTRWRSGSTLAGEMFNRNTDILYYFEPLAVFSNATSEIISSKKVQMLNETFDCIPPEAENYAKYVATSTVNYNSGLTQECINQVNI